MGEKRPNSKGARMVQLTNQEASRLLKGLIRLEAREPGVVTTLMSDLLEKLEPAAIVFDCQLRVARDLGDEAYLFTDDIFEWIEKETLAAESNILLAWLDKHPQGCSGWGQMTVGRFMSLEG